MAASPTPPQPKTATESPRTDLAGEHRGTEAGHDATAQEPGCLRAGGRIDLACTGRPPPACGRRTRRCPGRGSELGAVEQRHLLGRVVGGEAVLGPPAPTGPALPAHGAPVEHDVVTGGDVVDVGSDGLDDAGGLVAEQVRELVADGAVAGSAGRCGTPRRPGPARAPHPDRGRAPGSSRWSPAPPSRGPPPLGPRAPSPLLAVVSSWRRWTGIEPAVQGSPAPPALKAGAATRPADTSAGDATAARSPSVEGASYAHGMKKLLVVLVVLALAAFAVKKLQDA